MRILHLVEAFGGGLMTMIMSLSDRSLEAGHQVAIAYGTRPETPSQVSMPVPVGVELIPLWGSRRTAGAQLAAARQARALIAAWHPDVVHLHSSFSGVVGAVVTNGIPSVYTPNGFASELPHGAIKRNAYRAAERLACRRATVVGAVSQSEADLARGLGARRVVRIANGVPELDSGRDDSLFKGTKVAASRPRIVGVGRTVPQRLPLANARILSSVRDVADVQWLGGGGGPRGADGRRALEEAGVPVSGWLSRDELLRSLSGASAYLHWSAWEGLSLSLLEALALEIVVVASDIPPNREILGQSGVRSTEAEAIELLRRVITEPDLAEAMREAQRPKAQTFSADRMAAGWHGLYEELVDSRPAGP